MEFIKSMLKLIGIEVSNRDTIEHYFPVDANKFRLIQECRKKHLVIAWLDFEIDEFVCIQEYRISDKPLHWYTGREIFVKITDITYPGNDGLPDGVCVLSIE